MLNMKVPPEILAYCKRFLSESRLRLNYALTVETDWETDASESPLCGSDVDAGLSRIYKSLIMIRLDWDLFNFNFIYFNNF